MNRRVDIREDIKRYQDTLSYASSKVFDYSVGESIYMIRSDMNIKIRSGTVRYNNKILVSNEKFILSKNEKVNLTVPVMKSHKVTQTAARPKHNSNVVLSHVPNISHKPQEPQPTTHNEEKVALVLFIAGGFAIWNIFR